MMKMTRVCPAQMEKLLDLLSEDGVLENGKIMYPNTNKQNFWKRATLQLNAVEGGVYKNTWKWCKTWADWKNKTKRKANILLEKKSYKRESLCPALTDLELRLLKMISYPVDDRSEARQLEMTEDKLQEPDKAKELERMVSLDEYKSDVFLDDDDYHTKDCCNMNDVLCDDNEIGEKSMTDNKEREKKNGQLYKRKKTPQEEYNKRITMELEKQRLQHRTEELRLHAIELKLKGDELKLKEIEMSKISHLTAIEEEKLKCFKEISMSLKELLERSKSGNLRFHNSFE